jgi:hypothetical protein
MQHTNCFVPYQFRARGAGTSMFVTDQGAAAPLRLAMR